MGNVSSLLKVLGMISSVVFLLSSCDSEDSTRQQLKIDIKAFELLQVEAFELQQRQPVRTITWFKKYSDTATDVLYLCRKRPTVVHPKNYSNAYQALTDETNSILEMVL